MQLNIARLCCHNFLSLVVFWLGGPGSPGHPPGYAYAPKWHALHNEHVKQKQITSGKTALHALSDTRWTARSDNLDTIMNVYLALLSMFQQMSHGGNGTATGLLFRIKQLNFVTACLVLQKCFSLSRHASEYLQNEEMDLLTAVVASSVARGGLEPSPLACEVCKIARFWCFWGRFLVKNWKQPLQRKLGAEVVKYMSWFSLKKLLNFRFQAKNQSEFWWRRFFFWRPLVFGLKKRSNFRCCRKISLNFGEDVFFFGDHLFLGWKNLWIFELSEKFRLNFRTNSVILIQEQQKFESRSFALFSLFQKSPPPPFPNPGYAPGCCYPRLKKCIPSNALKRWVEQADFQFKTFCKRNSIHVACLRNCNSTPKATSLPAYPLPWWSNYYDGF